MSKSVTVLYWCQKLPNNNARRTTKWSVENKPNNVVLSYRLHAVFSANVFFQCVTVASSETDWRRQIGLLSRAVSSVNTSLPLLARTAASKTGPRTKDVAESFSPKITTPTGAKSDEAAQKQLINARRPFKQTVHLRGVYREKKSRPGKW